MTTAMLLGLSLAFEPKEPGLMDRPPRDPRAPILTGTLLRASCSLAGVMLRRGFRTLRLALVCAATIDQARTVAVNVFVLSSCSTSSIAAR